MSGHQSQLTKPGGGARDNLARHQSQDNLSRQVSGDIRYQSQDSTSTTKHQSQSSTSEANSQGLVSMSSLMQWQVNTAAGLRDKEEKMTNSLADTQKIKIESLRKEIEMVGTEVVRRKEENQTLSTNLSITKVEVEVLFEQLKTVSGQISRIKWEKTEMVRVEEEKRQELSRLAEGFRELHMVQTGKERSWREEMNKREEEICLQKRRCEEEDIEDFRQFEVLEDKIAHLAEEKLTVEKLIEDEDNELKQIEEKQKVAKNKLSLIHLESRKMVEERAKEEICLMDDLLKWSGEEEKKIKELIVLTHLMSDERRKGDEVKKVSVEANEKFLEIETEVEYLLMKMKEAELEEKELQNQMCVKSEVVDTLEKKIKKISRMQVENISLDTNLKESEGKILIAENELEHLRKVEEDKFKLDDENVELSHYVHQHEAEVLNCKTKISAAQEELKLKSGNLCLLEVKVQKLNISKRNKLAVLEKLSQAVLCRGAAVSSTKCSSSLLQAQLESLKADLVKTFRTEEDKTNSISNLGEELKAKSDLLDSLQDTNENSLARNAGLNNSIELEKASLDSEMSKVAELDTKKEVINSELNELITLKESAEAKLGNIKKKLINSVQEITGINEDREQRRLKKDELMNLTSKLKAENEMMKRDLGCALEELKSSDEMMKTSEDMKEAISEKTVDIKKLDEEIKNGKRHCLTVTNRKEKLLKQLEKNKAVSDSLAADLDVQEQKIVNSLDSSVELKKELTERSQESNAKKEATGLRKLSISAAVDEVSKIRIEVDKSRTRTDDLGAFRAQLISGDKQSVQEFQGLLVCREREFSDILTKLTSEVAELGRKNETMTMELDEQEMKQMKIYDEVDLISDDKVMLKISKQIETTKNESSKVDQKLKERQAQVAMLKKKVESIKTGSNPSTSVQTSRIFESANKTTSSLTKPPVSLHQSNPTPSSRRQARSLLPSTTPRPVTQSPVRTFLAPQPRPTASSHHPRAKKKTPPAPVMDFECVLGVSDEWDSS